MTTNQLPAIITELEELGIKVVLPLERVIYKYMTFDTALKIIESNSLLFSTPLNFNDPFDLTNGLIDVSFNKEILKKWIYRFGHLTRQEKRDLFNKSIQSPSKAYEMFNTKLDEFKRTAGITCFSKSYMKTLMWSHYADKHSGICLGFNIVPIGMENFTLLEVNYADNIKPLNFFVNKHNAFWYWVYTKSSVWSYEEEVRAFYSDRNGFVKFDKTCLKEVHFGLRTTKQQREDFIFKLIESKYSIKKLTYMTMDSKTFDLKENPLN
jgi:hypothetical protein